MIPGLGARAPPPPPLPMVWSQIPRLWWRSFLLFFIAFLRLSNLFKALDRRSENSKFYLLAAGCLAGWPAGSPAGGL